MNFAAERMLVLLVAAASAALLTGSAAREEPYAAGYSWTDPGTAGWTNSSGHASLGTTNGFLSISMPVQPKPEFAWDMMWAPLEDGVILRQVRFLFLAETVQPSALHLCLTTRSGREWHTLLTVPLAGIWGDFLVDLTDPAVRWIAGPNDPQNAFAGDVPSITGVGVYVRRHGSALRQDYRLNNVEIRGIMADSDGDGMPDIWERRFNLLPDSAEDGDADHDADGMSNADEFKAGTHPMDKSSVFRLDASAEEGIRLSWGSISNRLYTVFRAEPPDFTFRPLAQGLSSDPPRSRYFDESATNRGPYLYRVQVE
jgi:hypothetical protein